MMLVGPALPRRPLIAFERWQAQRDPAFDWGDSTAYEIAVVAAPGRRTPLNACDLGSGENVRLRRLLPAHEP
jgi:hypothetical protein